MTKDELKTKVAVALLVGSIAASRKSDDYQHGFVAAGDLVMNLLEADDRDDAKAAA